MGDTANVPAGRQGNKGSEPDFLPKEAAFPIPNGESINRKRPDEPVCQDEPADAPETFVDSTVKSRNQWRSRGDSTQPPENGSPPAGYQRCDIE